MAISEQKISKKWKKNFELLLKNAVSMGIYNPVDYSKKPKTYCGTDITDNPYFN